ncbi:MAG: chlorite dismutase [Chloroflexi bacterium HGW-Chloroflexi-3]|nr:MAG: chlorite dismutase [Chloroflexi bacterium HGW-Chloroflexi-3]
MSLRMLGHFQFFQFTAQYWNLSSEKRSEFQKNFLSDLEKTALKYELYQVYPLHAEVDIVLWITTQVSENDFVAQYFEKMAALINPYRVYLQLKESWWGMTHPSDYSRGKSAQEINPFEDQRNTYLIVYPFSKNASWYKMGRDTRQGMMNEHIRIGHQFPEIKQLLLYSTGLQDQEFIVTYETEDLAQFSQLVTDLRSSEARLFTDRDTPIFTAIYHSPANTLKLFE